MLGWTAPACIGSVNLPSIPATRFSGPGETFASLSVLDNAPIRSILLESWILQVNSSASSAQIQSYNHALNLELVLTGGLNNMITNYSPTTSSFCTVVVHSGLLSVIDYIPWVNVSIVANSLTVSSWYQLSLISSNATIWPIVSTDTQVGVICGQPATDSIVEWNLQTVESAIISPNITSTSMSCSIVVAGLILPTMLYTGVGDTSLTLNLYESGIAPSTEGTYKNKLKKG